MAEQGVRAGSVAVGLLLLAGCGGTVVEDVAAPPVVSLVQHESAPQLPIFASPGAGRISIPWEAVRAEREAAEQDARELAAAESPAPSPAATPRTSQSASPTRRTPSTQPPTSAPSTPPVTAALPPAPLPPGSADADFRATYERVRASVGLFATSGCLGNRYLGSGFLVGADLVVTNAHVLEDMRSWAFRLGGVTYGGAVVGLDSRQDLALVRLDRRATAPPLTLAATDPAVGTPVAAIGYATGLGAEVEAPSMQQGIVSGTDRTWDDMTGLLQSDAQASKGSSGGPVVTRDGTVAGVVAFGIGEPMNVVMSVGAPTARELVDGWLAAPRVVPPSC